MDDETEVVALPPPEFSIHHVEAVLRQAKGRAQAEQSRRALAEQYERDRARALFHVRVKDRT